MGPSRLLYVQRMSPSSRGLSLQSRRSPRVMCTRRTLASRRAAWQPAGLGRDIGVSFPEVGARRIFRTAITWRGKWIGRVRLLLEQITAEAPAPITHLDELMLRGEFAFTHDPSKSRVILPPTPLMQFGGEFHPNYSPTLLAEHLPINAAVFFEICPSVAL